MKRLELCVLFVLIVFVCPTLAQSKPTDAKTSMLQLCYRLWKSSSFGWNEKQTERAAWVIRDPDGSFRWVEWDNTEEHHAATWRRPVPKGVIAQIHTHPGFTDPSPSKQDIRVAQEIKAPVYTISGLGIWRAASDGKVTKEAGDNWYKKLK
jgi:hypothetical protein